MNTDSGGRLLILRVEAQLPGRLAHRRVRRLGPYLPGVADFVPSAGDGTGYDSVTGVGTPLETHSEFGAAPKLGVSACRKADSGRQTQGQDRPFLLDSGGWLGYNDGKRGVHLRWGCECAGGRAAQAMASFEIQREIPLNLFKSTNPLLGKVLENRRLTPPQRPPANDVRHIALSSPGLSYLPGQSIGVIPEGYDLRIGKPQKLRLYSVSSASKGDYGDCKTVSTVVVRHFWDNEDTGETSVPGVCSKHLCDCEVGDEVKVTGPVGKRFLLPTDFHQRDLIFVATGTGIAPYRGMIKEVFDQDYQGKLFLIFGVQYADTVLYDDEFRWYLDRPNFRYITALSREAEKNPFPDEVPTRDNKMYVQVRMWEHRQEIRQSLEKPDTIVYQCGLKGMEAGVFQVIDKIGGQMGQPDLSELLRAEGRMLLEVY